MQILGIDKCKGIGYNKGMNKITDFLDKNSMTQGQLADRLDYDLSYVNQIINGRRQISDAFRWRWLTEFGITAMSYLNGDAEATE